MIADATASADDAMAFDICRWMDPPAIAAFDAAVRLRSYRAGQVIYRQGEPGNEMYRIVSGSVRLSVGSSDGREVVFVIFRDGACFGDSSMVDGGARPQTAEAIGDTSVQMLDRAGFEALRRDHARFGDAMMRLLAAQMRAISEQFVDISLNDLATRIATRILRDAQAVDVQGDGEMRLALRLPQSELASMVGASRQSVNKTLQRLQRDGLIVIDYNVIQVRDAEGLRRLLETR